MTSTISDDPQAGVCPLPDWELWGCATTVERVYGGYAYDHIAERIRTLARGGDWDGVATWNAIAARLDQLHTDGAKQ